MSVDKLVEKIEQWGVDRNITADGGATVQDQFSKALEEVSEGFSTLSKCHKLDRKKIYLDWSEAVHATQTGGMQCPGLRLTRDALDERINKANEQLRDDIGDVVVCMIQAARLAGFTLEECLKQSWKDIKDREGWMIDGKFVKKEE